ncbi:(2Fe-2S)-binding protein [Marinomonas sp.]|uniref:(2Fe-2S)-binding protein n=1 Tax=Marinomonas sp. TaxID=1904862 RepID=UPI003BAD997E
MSSTSTMARIKSLDLLESTEAFKLIGLSIGQEQQFRPLKEFSSPNEIFRQLSHQTNVQPNMDVRTQGTYLISSLSWSLAEIVSWLDLNLLNLENIWGILTIKENLMSVVDKGRTYQYASYGWQLPELTFVLNQQDANSVGQNFIICLTPFVNEIRQQTGMAKGALWRLVTDALAASYLNSGKKLGLVRNAMDRAFAIINETGGVLANPKWHFKEYSVDAASSPTGLYLNDWFRVRGGCCRYYTLSGGEYCSTCIHLAEGEREERLKKHISHSTA